jgi:hypothetical protein
MEPLIEISRRRVLGQTALGGLSWLTPVAHLLAREAGELPGSEPAQSLIFLWLAGGPSQLETFDPHPGKMIAGDTKAIPTSVSGIQLAEGYERLAEAMGDVALLRSLVSKEGDHERGTYMVKTGYRPSPTVVHPSIGAICCHQLPLGEAELPRHISILPGQWPALGGLLGKQYDAFRTYDPANKVPSIAARVSDERFQRRLDDLAIVENAFARGRSHQAQSTLHLQTVAGARKMMTSKQVTAFDVGLEPAELRAAYGDTPFGRGCLAARRLIEAGVRCVEVTLDGWDSHANNHEVHRNLARTLDPALSALLTDLRQRDLLRKTIVLCGGEFGRTPQINPAAGRDHWPQGFTMLLAGGRLRGGVALGETDPEGGREIAHPYQVADLHATVLTALGIDPHHQELAPIGRPIRFSEGEPIAELLG